MELYVTLFCISQVSCKCHTFIILKKVFFFFKEQAIPKSIMMNTESMSLVAMEPGMFHLEKGRQQELSSES